MDLGEEGSTPTSQWRPSPSWWVGDDARSEDGRSNLTGHEQAPPRRSSRLSQEMSTLESDHSNIIQQAQESVTQADPRSMFGPLPNSSFNDVLDNPIQRELERREVKAAERTTAEVAVAQRRPSAVADRQQAASFADATRQSIGGAWEHSARENFWRDECSRLQVQLASLSKEKDRYLYHHARNSAQFL